MKLLDIFESRSHPKRLNLVESDQIRIGMSSYDVDLNDQDGRITLDVTQQGMTVAELVYESGEIVWIHVEPWFRKQGLAEAMLEYLRERGLKVVMPDARTSDGRDFFKAMQQRGKLDEAFDTTPLPFSVSRSLGTDQYQFEYQHRMFLVKVYFEKKSAYVFLYDTTTGVYQVNPTGKGGTVPVFGTSIAILKDFVSHHPTIEKILFDGSKSNGLSDFYNRLVPYMTSKFNWKYDRDVYDDAIRGVADFAVYVKTSDRIVTEVESIGDLDDSDHDLDTRQMKLTPGAKPVARFGDVDLYQDDPQHFEFFQGERPVGFAHGHRGPHPDLGNWITIGLIWLDPSVRQKGIGTQFYEWLLGQDLVVISDTHQSDTVQVVWEKLVQKYEAALLHDGAVAKMITSYSELRDGYDVYSDEDETEVTIAVFPRRRTTPLLAESLIEDDGEFDWTKPTTFYRGIVDPTHAEQPFTGTRRGVPTFTDDWSVANTYARHPNDLTRDAGKSDQVYAYRLNIRNPIHLNVGREDVTEANYILKTLGATTVGEGWELFRQLLDIISWRANGETWFTDEYSGVEFPVEIEGWGDNPTDTYENLNHVFVDHWNHNWPGLYCTSFELADNHVFQNMVRAAGYDGIVYYGHTSVEWDGITDDDILTGTSFDGTHAMEWRALDPSQVEYLGPAGRPPRLTEALNSPVRFNISHNSDSRYASYNFSYNGEEFRVGFKESGEFWNVVFVNVNQDLPFDPTGLGGGIPVLSTVIAIVKDFITLYPQVKTLRFSGENHNGLADLYRQMVRTLSKRLGIRFEEDRLQYQSQFLVHLRESVTEAFDTAPAPFSIYRMTPTDAVYYFDANGMEFEVEFTLETHDYDHMRLSQPHWNILYGPSGGGDGKWAPTGNGGSGEILSTVVAIVKDFVDRQPRVNVLHFMAGGDSHVRLYTTMVPYLARRLNFDYKQAKNLNGGYAWWVYPHEKLHETVKHSDQVFEHLYASIYRDRTFSRETSTNLDDFIRMIEDEYEEILWWEPGTPNLMETPEWWYGFRTWLGKRYQYVVKNIQSEIGGYPVILNREMTVTANWNPDKHGLGVYWATAGGEIHAFSGKEGPGYQIAWMTAEVQESDINWFDTIRSRLDFATGDEEQEIQLKPNVKIKLIDIDVSRPAYKSEGVKINVRPGVYPTTAGVYESLSSVPTHTPKQIAAKHGVVVSMVTKQLAKGIKIEHEHTTSPSEARQIALDHLWELPDYYDRLGSMERQAGLSEGPAVPLRVTPRMIARAKDNKCQIIVEMPIQQFLDMTTPDHPAQQRIASNSKSILDYNRWAKMANDPAVAKRFNDQRQQKHTGEEPYEPEYGNDLMPFLQIRLNNNGSFGWVVGHEGRHRGSASMKAGAKTMQVSLRIYPGEDMFPDQYSPDYFITQEHLPSHLVGQFNKDVYPTGGWKIIDGDLQKRTRERILR